jgi:hypothetical protein
MPAHAPQAEDAAALRCLRCGHSGIKRERSRPDRNTSELEKVTTADPRPWIRDEPPFSSLDYS